MITSDVWKEIIADQAKEPGVMALAVRRDDLVLHPLRGKATIITGSRRAGKSTYLRQWLEEHRGSHPILSLNFVDERLGEVNAPDLGGMITAFQEDHPAVSRSTPSILCLDEIQRVNGWELFVERQLRLGLFEIFLTGSSARMFSADIATEMRGRSLRHELFPFSFREFLRGRKVSEGNSSAERALIRKAWREYSVIGGFPEVVLAPAASRKPILQEYFATWVTRDLVERLQLPSAPAARAFLKKLLLQFSAPMTLNRFIERLKAQGHGIGRENAARLLAAAEDAYVAFTVPILSESVHQQQTRPKKIYAIDVGLPAALSVSRNDDAGRRLENLVFLELKRQSLDIRYFLTPQGHEVDFVVPGQPPIQCCYTLADEETQNRELRALEAAMVSLGSREALILTHDEEGSHRVKGVGEIEILPAWKWLLAKKKRPPRLK